jgi:hypothetical protein
VGLLPPASERVIEDADFAGEDRGHFRGRDDFACGGGDTGQDIGIGFGGAQSAAQAEGDQGDHGEFRGCRHGRPRPGNLWSQVGGAQQTEEEEGKQGDQRLQSAANYEKEI